MTWENSWIWYLAIMSGILVWGWSILQILTTRYSPAGTSAWLLLIVLMPFAGVPLYAVFGGRKVRKVMRRKHRIHLRRSTVVDVNYTGNIDRLLRGLGVPGATCGNVFTLLPDSVASRRGLETLIAGAEHSIDLVTYVFKNDRTGRAVVELLARKAAAGVKVRLLYDSIGSLATSEKLFHPLREAGGEVEAFMPTRWWPFRSRTNLRNHRKLVVADGKRVWGGGMNIGDEYLGADANSWTDLSFLLEGPAVQPLAELFNMDWSFATEREPPPPPAPVPAIFNGDEGIVQTVPSGPDVEHDPLYAALLGIAFEARERLWIATPYFVPNDSLNEALCFAALRGVDVRIIVPQRSNHRMPDLARGPFLRDLQKAGGKIHLLPGMMHGKLLVMDDRLALHGSANVDWRSLFLNFELGTICYSRSEVDIARKWIETLLQNRQPRTAAPTLGTQLTEGVMRLVAPLL
ncbi:MAG TPA: phospholipase D-like domain-containing protein [Kiloniellales bacterium]|nr:phospholipase D-like domain-containing protein [Kiloniellales bacterium]